MDNQLNHIGFFEGMYILNPVSIEPVRVTEVSQSLIKIEGLSGNWYNKRTLIPVSITPSRISCFGFGCFHGDRDKVYYHEENPEDPEADFYAEYSFLESTLILSYKDHTVEEKDVMYIHQLQKILIDSGFKKLAVETKVPFTGNIKFLN